MNITIQCPHCSSVLNTDDSYLGQEVSCSQCLKTFIISKNTPSPTAPPAPAFSQPAGAFAMSGQNNYPRRTCGKATGALVCGIIGLVCCQICSILAIVFGFLAKGEIRNSNGQLEGDTMATVGIVLGFLGLAWGVLFFLLGFASTFAEVLESL